MIGWYTVIVKGIKNVKYLSERNGLMNTQKFTSIMLKN